MDSQLKIFATIIEDEATRQIHEFLKSPAAEGTKVRIMPDVHAGKGCVVGFTCSFDGEPERIVPNIIGVDIGCGMTAYPLKGATDLHLQDLDVFIRERIPSGLKVWEKDNWSLYDKHLKTWSEYRKKGEHIISQLRCSEKLRNTNTRLYYAMGSLGGGNHFIEIDVDSQGEHWLIIHSGSRNLGLQVANHYQHLASTGAYKERGIKKKIDETIARLKEEGREKEIHDEIENIKTNFKPFVKISEDLMYVDGQELADYIHDQRLCVQWAKLNREMMVRIIVEKFFNLQFNQKNLISSIHNYISEDNIIRKGSCSAYDGELLLIPMNMRDGTLLCRGKGNPDWNFSAPHGAGRLMSRTKAFATLSLDQFKEEMKDVASWSVSKDTLDESPMAYKPVEAITELIGETVDIIDTWKPVYNFKANN